MHSRGSVNNLSNLPPPRIRNIEDVELPYQYSAHQYQRIELLADSTTPAFHFRSLPNTLPDSFRPNFRRLPELTDDEHTASTRQPTEVLSIDSEQYGNSSRDSDEDDEADDEADEDDVLATDVEADDDGLGNSGSDNMDGPSVDVQFHGRFEHNPNRFIRKSVYARVDDAPDSDSESSPSGYANNHGSNIKPPIKNNIYEGGHSSRTPSPNTNGHPPAQGFRSTNSTTTTDESDTGVSSSYAAVVDNDIAQEASVFETDKASRRTVNTVEGSLYDQVQRSGSGVSSIHDSAHSRTSTPHSRQTKPIETGSLDSTHLHNNHFSTQPTEESMETGDPLTVEEAMSDELLFRAIRPILKRTISVSSVGIPGGIQLHSPDTPTTKSPSPKRRKSGPLESIPLPEAPWPSDKDSTPDDSSSSSDASAPEHEATPRSPLPLPNMPLPSDSEPSSGDDSDSDQDLGWYRDPRSNITLPEFATITQHYLHRRHHLTDEAARDMRDFHEAMKKRRKTLRMIARSEAEKRGEELILDELNTDDDEDDDNEVNIPLLDEDIIGRVLDVALADKFEMHTMRIRRAKPLIYESTGVKVDLIHRCPKGCKAFNTANELSCKFCGSNRFKADGRTPTATFPYIKLLPRLRLWFSDPGFMEMMCKYRREAEKEDKELTDFWNSKHYKKLKRSKNTPVFKDKYQRDLAFLLTTDELTPFKSKAYYRLTPMVLVCYNIPPQLRTKMRFLLTVGFIPGRDRAGDCPASGVAKPQDRQSFFEPLVKELEMLYKGAPCYDSVEKENFTLRGFLVLVGADMVERAELLGFYGHKGKSFCEYCRMTGIKMGGLYTPTTAPRNAPPWLRSREARMREQGRPFYAFSGDADDARKNQLGAIKRTKQHIDRCYDYIRRHPGDKSFQQLHGIRGISIFSRLHGTVSIPHGFPPDHMHLSRNIGQLMVEIYNGSIFQRDSSTVAPGAPTARNRRPAASPHRNRTHPSANPSSSSSSSPSDSDDEQENREPEDPGHDEDEDDDGEEDDEDNPMNEPFIIAKDEWVRIGENQERSKASFPVSMGEIDNISRFMGTMTSASWMSWILNQSLVYFHGRIPRNHFEGYSKFVEIIRLSSQRRMYHHEVDRLESLIREFLQYFEDDIYKYDVKRLRVWRPVLHQLRHVPDAIRRFGPMYLYSQWTIERYHQRIKPPLQKCRGKPNEHLANVVCDWQCLNSLAFVLPLVGGIAGINLNTLEGDVYSDASGNLKISKLFKDALVYDDTKVVEILANENEQIPADALDINAFVRMDRPWFPRDLDMMLPQPRERHPRLPLPRAGSGSETEPSSTDTDGEAAEDVGDVFDAITTERVMKHRILTGPYSQITENHKRLIIRTLVDWFWVSDAFLEQTPAMRKIILVDPGHMHSKKWKTMIMVRAFTGLSFMPPLVCIRITGTESPHWARKRSNAWIYYRGPDGGKRYGEVLYFVSSLDARDWPYDQGREAPPRDLHLAVVRRHKPEMVANCLLRIRKTRPESSTEVIETEAIEDEVGLIQDDKFFYIVTRIEGCYLPDRD